MAAPHESRHYRMLLNDRPAGRETFWFRRQGSALRVDVETRLDGQVWLFPADFRHCRIERWEARDDRLELIALEAATRYAVPFKPDQEIWIERDPADGGVVYRGASSIGSFEERYPAGTGAITPWSLRTVDYGLVLNVFEHGAYPVEPDLVEHAMVNGKEIAHYAMNGAWPRHLWYSEGLMIRFCGREAFGTTIETVLESYADRAVDAVGLSRPCAAVFE